MSVHSDTYFMQMALDRAAEAWGSTAPNPMVGAVIVRGENVLATGYHHKAGEAHAEADALNNAAKSAVDVRGATIYVTLEPCSNREKLKTSPLSSGTTQGCSLSPFSFNIVLEIPVTEIREKK